MKALTRLALRRPWFVLIAWWSVMGTLALIGLGAPDRLHRADLDLPGTASDKAAELARGEFGEASGLVVLLKGPQRELERQGPQIARTLEEQPHVRVLEWSPGGAEALRPEPGEALLLVRVDQPFEESSRDVAPELRSLLKENAAPPLEAHMSGYPDIANGVHQGSLDALKQAELIAAPLLILILLLVFRSVIAASLPLAVGFATIGAATGVLDLVNRINPLDVVALNLASMMGLALGVDYSLLLVSRFREEVGQGKEVPAAAATAVATAGRTVVFAGLALVAASLTAYFTSAGDLLASAAAGIVVAVCLSVFASLTSLPACLVIFGAKMDRWGLPSKRSDRSAFGGLAVRTVRRPALAAALVLGLVLALSAPALGLQSGPPDPRVLPEDSEQRSDWDAIEDALGSGWAAPYEITVAVDKGAVTSPERLAALDRWQARQAENPEVVAVLGPGPIADRTKPLTEASGRLAEAQGQLKRASRDQERLEGGLDRAGDGAADLRAGLAEASEGADRLADGGGAQSDGAELLESGLSRARSGALELRSGLDQGREGAQALAAGTGRARRGAERLRAGLGSAGKRTGAGLPQARQLARGLQDGADGLAKLRAPAELASAQLEEALKLLRGMLPSSKLDPNYQKLARAVGTASGAISGIDPRNGQPARPGYEGLPAELARASEQAQLAAAGMGRLLTGLSALEAALARLEAGAGAAARGLERLDRGAGELLIGIERLGDGGGSLVSGLERLHDGAGRLGGGAGRIEAGAQRLGTGLSGGAARTGRLANGIERMEQGVVAARVRTKQFAGSLRNSDRLADSLQSGYFTLAALDTAPPRQRSASSFGVNLDEGGSAAQIVVIGKGDVNRAGHPLRDELERELEPLAREVGGTVRVGGPAAVLQDFDSGTFSRFWLLVVALCVVTYLVLVPVLRSVVLPALAVVLNVATVAAAFGVLVVLFNGDAPLGGPGWLDAIMVAGIFSIVFGLSIDYEVFLLARMREGYALTGSTEAAIRYGVERTAGVVTGAALIMTGVFVAFAMTDLVSMRQFGIGLTVAVLLDATLVRLVLLPAAIRLCGDRVWWMPAWLDRFLPEIKTEVSAEPQETVRPLRPPPETRTGTT